MVSHLSPMAFLMPVVLTALRKGLGNKACERVGVGQMRRDFAVLATVPGAAGASNILGRWCHECGRCPMARE